jgi:hypothetical protein
MRSDRGPEAFELDLSEMEITEVYSDPPVHVACVCDDCGNDIFCRNKCIACGWSGCALGGEAGVWTGMKKYKYLEQSTVAGSFKSKADGERWCDEKRNEGYSVKGPFNNKMFAFSHEYPWEATAMATFTIEGARS